MTQCHANAAAVTEAHHFNAAWRDGDHIHEGLGFLPQHIKLTNLFELSVQAVDPSVALPFWDYTRDQAAGGSLRDSAVFTEETFGSLPSPANSSLGWTYRYAIRCSTISC